MRSYLTAMAMWLLMLLVGCASPMVSDYPTKSLAENQKDLAACAAFAARVAQAYAWNPPADLAAIRADTEAACLESRGWTTRTDVSIWASTAARQLRQEQPDPVRRCFQQAYAWLGRYDGPIDGRTNVIWQAAQQAYLTEHQIVNSYRNAANLVPDGLRQELQAIGKAEDWQACLRGTTEQRR